MAKVWREQIGKFHFYFVELYFFDFQLREQAKAVGLLGQIIPYETEGTSELTVSFGGLSCRRGNLILPEQVII
jgi:hypothetical protein